MTDMQLIVPPLEDKNHEEVAARPADDHDHDHDGVRPDESRDDGQGNVLPDEVRANFEAMKAVWRQARRANGAEGEELRRKERQLAAETAASADAEIAKWQSGIAELEALLAAEEGEDEEEEALDDGHGHPVVEFPSLLSVVPHEEDDIDYSDSSDIDHESNHCSWATESPNV